ncbi:MAG: isoprenylcysteine carboxylmethyltransferase family protein [Chthoniobacterales bacterium]
MKSPPIPLPPPILMLVLLLLSALLTSVAPIAFLTIPFHGAIATLFILAGVGSAAAGFFSFKSRRTPVRPGAEPTQLVLSGPYRITRNPMYLGLLLISIGCLFAFESLWFLIPPIVFFGLINFRLIPFEEQLLHEHFGVEYDAYRKRVRRWL